MTDEGNGYYSFLSKSSGSWLSGDITTGTTEANKGLFKITHTGGAAQAAPVPPTPTAPVPKAATPEAKCSTYPGFYSIQSKATSKYVSSYPNGLIWSPVWASLWEFWKVVCIPDSEYYCLNNNQWPTVYLNIGQTLQGQTGAANQCPDQFQVKMVDEGNGYVSFQSKSTELWLNADITGGVNQATRGLYKLNKTG